MLIIWILSFIIKDFYIYYRIYQNGRFMKKILLILLLSSFSLSIMCPPKKHKERVLSILNSVITPPRLSLKGAEKKHYNSIRSNIKNSGKIKTTHSQAKDVARYMELAYNLSEKQNFTKMKERVRKLAKLGPNYAFPIVDEIYTQISPGECRIQKEDVWPLVMKSSETTSTERAETLFRRSLCCKTSLIKISDDEWPVLLMWSFLLKVSHESHKAEQLNFLDLNIRT
jgi:ribosomal protein L17